MYKVVLRWIEAIGPDGDWNEEHDEYYIAADDETEAVFKAAKILDYQCSDYGEGSQVRVHYASAEPTDEPEECDLEKYFGEDGYATNSTYQHFVDTYSMRIIPPDSNEYLPHSLRTLKEEV